VVERHLGGEAGELGGDVVPGGVGTVESGGEGGPVGGVGESRMDGAGEVGPAVRRVVRVGGLLELPGELLRACAGGSEGVLVGERGVELRAGAVVLGGEPVDLPAESGAGAGQLGDAVLQPCDDPERSVDAELVGGDGEAAAGDVGQLEAEVRFGEAAGGGEDVEAADGPDDTRR
jgi:hypothetical protein